MKNGDKNYENIIKKFQLLNKSFIVEQIKKASRKLVVRKK